MRRTARPRTEEFHPVITRMSSLFLRTLREDPADAEVPSHRLLVRAGYVRRVAPGIFSWLPLGYLVLRNIERVIRAEMDAAGFQEVHFPALLPAEPYEVSGRWTKYRDEPRPRAGILRGREFVMKDSYSFDVDDAGLQASYERHRAAYLRTFDRLGLQYVIVSAMSGAMGGSASEEFLAPTETGEDTFVECTNGDYAANVEAVQTQPPAPVPYDDAPAAHVEDTPDTPTIETLV